MIFLVFDCPLGKIGIWQLSANSSHCFCVCLVYWLLNSQSLEHQCPQGTGDQESSLVKKDLVHTADKAIKCQRKGAGKRLSQRK